MAVQLEIKSQLSKLLATEDLVVEHKQVPSAQFNVHTRVLTLPLWEKASNTVYDLLVGHEVGHALFTPDEDFGNVPHQFVNVVEDARIEKLMKRKYMGLAKTFYKGYEELSDEDFFELEDQDISTFNLADRANLYFKIGNYISIDFCVKEQEIIDMIGRCETFDDVKKAAFVLYEYCKQKKKEDEGKVESKEIQPDTGEGESFADTFFDDGDGEEDTTTTEKGGTQTTEVEAEPEVHTAESLDNKLQELVNTDGDENIYVEVPKVNLDSVIASNSDVHGYIDKHFKQQQFLHKEHAKKYEIAEIGIYESVDSQFAKFKKEAQKEVNYLVKEFECRKSASAYSRSAINRTGVLDTKKLQNYKFSEELFKKVTILPDGKNHGLVFILDWSGSMQYVMEDTCKQLFNLIWFCKKVQIPFEVYAFTREWCRPEVNLITGEREEKNVKPHYKAKEGLLCVDDEFNLMNLFTSKSNARELEKQMINIWRISSCFRQYYNYTYPPKLCLSGTPLNETFVVLHQILPQFQKENGVEKVQCIVLTDGEANGIPFYKIVQRHWESEPYMGMRNIHSSKCFLRDRKLGRVYKFGFAWHELSKTLINNLKDNFPSVNFIGIRVLGNRDANNFIKLHYPMETKERILVEKDWKKNKSFNIKASGYDAYFGMSSATLSQDSEFDVDEDATKAQIKKAFAKSLKVKKLNKKVLGEFIELVV